MIFGIIFVQNIVQHVELRSWYRIFGTIDGINMYTKYDTIFGIILCMRFGTIFDALLGNMFDINDNLRGLQANLLGGAWRGADAPSGNEG